MKRIEDQVKEMINDRFGSVPKLAKSIDMPVQTIYTALRSGLAGAQAGTVVPIASALSIDPTWLIKNRIVSKGTEPSDFTDVPLYGASTADTPIKMLETDEKYPIPSVMHERHPNAFLLKVEGESMNRILPDKSYALVTPCKEIDEDGKPYAVCVNGFDTTIKRVRALNNGFELVPDSNDPTYKPKVYDYGVPGTDTITVIGRVVWYCIPYDWDF